MRKCVCQGTEPRFFEVRVTANECDVPQCPSNRGRQGRSRPPREEPSVARFLVRSLSASSISGLNQTMGARNPLQRVLWLTVLSCCLCGFSYQTYKFLEIYNRKPTVVQIEVENDGLAEFPAVTVCNTNRFRKSEFCKFKPENCSSNRNVSLSERQIGDIVFELLAQKQLDTKRLLGHSPDIVQGCVFNGDPSVPEDECLRILELMYDPDYGNCYTFPGKNEAGKVLEASEADFWQEANDLVILVDMESDEFMERKRHPGVIVTIHDDSTLPDIHTDGILLTPGESYSFGIQKSTVRLLQRPYKTNCTNYEVLPWHVPHKRRFTSRMCTVGCSQHFQMSECGFVTKNLSLFYEVLPYDPHLSTTEMETCAQEVEISTKEYCKTVCGLPCRDITFPVTVGSSDLTKRDLLHYSLHSWKNRTWEENLKNLALVKIFFSTLEHKIFRHQPKYESMELFSYLGGYSGVWLGFSLLTVYELLEIFACTAMFAFRKHQRARQHRRLVRTITRKPTKQMVRNFHKKRLYK